MYLTLSLYFSGPPYFTKSPRNTTVRAGEDVMLPCAAHGDPPPKTRWLRVGPGFPIGENHALKKYEQFILNTSCFCTMYDFHNFGLIFVGQCTVCLKG